MNRRTFLLTAAVTLAAGAKLPLLAQDLAGEAGAERAGAGDDPRAQFDRYFIPLLEGFLRNARATSPDYVVCDYPDGTMLKSCTNPAGRTYVSVTRMLPAMVEWLSAGRQPTRFRAGDGGEIELRDVLLSIFAHAFDPEHPEFWGYAPDNRATQLSVEAALVASALVRAGNDVIDKLTPQQRANAQKWLASCTQVTERNNNHAWFTACNQAARLELSRTFPEFSGDEAWMLADLEAMDKLATRGTTDDGWYTDSPDQPIFDVYNFYVFHNFPLMWAEITGKRYPQWTEKFQGRIKRFLEKTPYFFAGNGSHPLMGRSLIYRWAVLSPLVLGYREGLWPHSPGLLRAIVRKQLEYHWRLGCFDAERGKLRESFSDAGTPAAREPYIDNGHPYWCMLGNAFLGIPADDPFWTAQEEPLPVEREDFVIHFDGPKMLLSGTKRTGEVRWVQALNAAKRDTYRDKYSKLTWSSHFAFNSIADKQKVPPDQALVFRNLETGEEATRAPAGVTEGRLLKNGVETKWWTQLGEWKFEVLSRVRLLGDYEERTHWVTAPPEAVGRVELIEGTYPLGGLAAVPEDLKPDVPSYVLESPGRGAIGIWRIRGFDRLGLQLLRGANLIDQEVAVLAAAAPLRAPQLTLASIHYASPDPPALIDIYGQGDVLAPQWREGL